MENLIWPLALAAVAGAADVIGGALVLARRGISRNSLLYLTALAAGFILAAAVLDRIPDSMHENPHGAIYILLGFLSIYLIENLFATHAHDVPDTAHTQHAHDHRPGEYEDHGHSLVAPLAEGEPLISAPASYTAFLGLGIHTFFDGVAIGAGFATSVHTGIIMFLAVIFHKLPEGVSIASVMLAANRPRRTAFLAACGLGVATVLGAVFASVIGHEHQGVARALLTLATGSFLYIGASDLIPATNRGRNRVSVLFVLIGVALFWLSLTIVQSVGLPH